MYQPLLSVQNSVNFDSGISYLAIILDVVDLAVRRPGEHAEAAAVPGTLHTADTRQYWIICWRRRNEDQWNQYMSLVVARVRANRQFSVCEI